ncbi:MAG: alpha/beta hydrolase [Cyanobacteria bacterium P01_H01_bin.21]
MLTTRLLATAAERPDLPLLVFLPGMDGSDLSLRQQSGELKNRFDARCFCIPKNDLTDWAGLVARLVELVTLEKKSRPHRLIYLCGESFGACLALKAISSASTLFDRLILLNPASSFKQQFWSAFSPTVVKWMPGYELGAFGLLPFLISFERVPKSNRQALLQAMQQVTPETAAWRLSLLNSFELEQTALTQFRAPTLLVASVADRLLPSVNEAQRLANLLPDPQIITLPYSSHACLLETGVSLYQLLNQTQFIPALRV